MTRTAWTFLVTAIAVFMAALDNLVVTTALPVIRADFGATLSELEWMVNAYTLTFAVLLLTGAALGDRFGRKRLFIIGLAHLHRRLGRRRPVVDLDRADHRPRHPGHRRRHPHPAQPDHPVGRGQPGAASRRARRLGRHRRSGDRHRPARRWRHRRRPRLAVDLLGQRPDRPRRHPAGVLPARGDLRTVEPLDLPGLGLVSAGLFAIVWGLVNGNELGWTRPADRRHRSAIGALLIAAFVAWEARTADPMLPLRLFRSRAFTAANVVSMLMTFGMFGSIFLLAQFFQVVQGYSPLEAGLRTLPWTFMPVIVAPIAGLISTRTGTRPLLVLGMALQAVALGVDGGRSSRRPSST